MLIRLEEDQIRFSEDYKTAVRNQWFSMGKPGAKRLLTALPADSKAGRKPSMFTLQIWMKEDFIPFAEKLDNAIQEEMNNHLVAEKVEMLMRHTETAQEMQNISLEWLRKHKDDLNAISAARLLTAGIEIERMSRGIPKVMMKIANMTQEELLGRIQDIASRSSTTIEPVELPEEVTDEEFKDE